MGIAGACFEVETGAGGRVFEAGEESAFGGGGGYFVRVWAGAGGGNFNVDRCTGHCRTVAREGGCETASNATEVPAVCGALDYAPRKWSE